MSVNKLFKNTPLHKSIHHILSENNFEIMTDVQSKTIPNLCKLKDVIVQSQTGTGKTLAFVLPIVSTYFKTESTYKNHPISLVISPTRELALQITDVFNLFKIKTSCLIGGINIEEDLHSIKNTKIIIGTPGRLLEILKKNTNLLSRITFLILDEADRLMDLGFKENVLNIVSFLPKQKTTGFFSATITEDLKILSKLLLKNPIIIENEENDIPANLVLNYFLVDTKNKYHAMMNLVKLKKTIVFFATCNQVEFFHSIIKRTTCFKIHRKMKQQDRQNVYKDFYEKGDLLLCTDVAARGIDFKDIELVIHFDIPSDYTNIIHRSGRTARNNNKGLSILFVMPNEVSYLNYLKIKNINIQEYNFNDEKLNSLSCDDINNDFVQKKSFFTADLSDYDLDLSVRAFVSYFRSYKEHKLNYLLDYTTLNYDELVELYMLKKIPGMAELKNYNFKNFPREKKIFKIENNLEENKLFENEQNAYDTEKKTIKIKNSRRKLDRDQILKNITHDNNKTTQKLANLKHDNKKKSLKKKNKRNKQNK